MTTIKRLCRSCAFFQTTAFDSILDFGKCVLFKMDSALCKHKTYLLAETCRKDESKCGREAKLFKPKIQHKSELK